jgi:hypothetical protein
MNKRERREQYLSTRRPVEYLEKRKEMNKPRTKGFPLNHIKDILSIHPSDCVFELDAPNKILQRMTERGLNDYGILDRGDRDEINAWRQCWHESEIFCPHEGINRLAECGVKSLDWELA